MQTRRDSSRKPRRSRAPPSNAHTEALGHSAINQSINQYFNFKQSNRPVQHIKGWSSPTFGPLIQMSARLYWGRILYSVITTIFIFQCHRRVFVQVDSHFLELWFLRFQHNIKKLEIKGLFVNIVPIKIFFILFLLRTPNKAWFYQ